MTDTTDQVFDKLKANVVDSIKVHFPFDGKKQRIELSNVRVDDKLDASDIRSQVDVKDKDGTWGVPVKANIKLINKITGEVVDEKKNAVLARIPKLTNRNGFLVNGNEYQVDHLFRLKPGAYARVQENGDLETEYNLAQSRFSIKLDSKTKKFSFKIGNAHIPLYPILKTMGISDDQLESEWGKTMFSINKSKNEKQYEDALTKFVSKTSDSFGPEPTTPAAIASHIHKFFNKTELLPETTVLTLGKPFSTVNGAALAAGAKKILGVAAGTQKPDDRDSLAFKEILGVEDFIPERINRSFKAIHNKLRNTIDHKQAVGDILSTDLFNHHVQDFFLKNGSVAQRSDQTNPIQMFSAGRKTTLMGADVGGIKNDNALVTSMKTVNPSSFGFLDPMHVPESLYTGITLHLSSSARKNGKELETPVYDKATGKISHMSVTKLHDADVVLPDQVTWKDGKPTPISSVVKVKLKGGDIKSKKFSDVKYIMPSAKGLFDTSSNLIPFLPTNQGNRVSMADKQMEQAISLKYKEVPLVQSRSANPKEGHTFEEEIGGFTVQKAPVNGVVVSTKSDAIVISDGKKKHEVQIYDHFPLNDPKGMLHSTSLVKVGDKVKAGDVIADSNYTKNGVLALGHNLRIGYMPYKGYNYEDGIVISNSAAVKLTSDHLYKKELELDPAYDVVSKTRLKAHSVVKASEMKKEDWDALDADGIIKPGSIVRNGQVLVAAVGKNINKDKFLDPYGKRSVTLVKDKSLTWDENHTGEVTKVVSSKNGKSVKVFVKTEEPIIIGDKITDRHGAKGIITSILDNEKMPFTINKETGEREHLEVLLNPTGVPSRINTGQILETAAAKIAKKTGKPYIVDNFSGVGTDYRQQVLDDLKKHGIEDEELVYDPDDIRKPLGSVLVGPKFIMKLQHQAEKKLSVRGGGTTVEGRRLGYTSDRQPVKGAQAFGQLDMYALLGHNARNNIREMSTYKSDMQDQNFWSMIQEGHEPPPPKAPFSYHKFEALLNGLGVNLVKEGTSLRLTPTTNKEILARANNGRNEIVNSKVIRAKDLKEEQGGLFDPIATGGNNGDKWSFVRLSEPLPNPIFVGHGNTQGPIPELLGMKIESIEKVLQGKAEIDGKTGGAAIEHALNKININSEISKLKDALPTLRSSALDRANKKLKYFLALKSENLTPSEAYMLHSVPIIPPKFRPVTATPTGDLSMAPINGLYRNIISINDQLKHFDSSVFSDEHKNPLRAQLWDSMKAMEAVGVYKPVYDHDKSGNRALKGILDTIGGGEGEQPKDGFFQNKLIRRRQDLTMRATIVPEPTLNIDEVGLPKDSAMELYKPYVVAQLTKWGHKPIAAQELMKASDPLAWKALENVVADRPVLLKRDPVLHKFSVLAFKPKLVAGKTIQIHPLVTGSFNADFDGDAMSGSVPMSKEAVEEAKKMFPSKNLFSPTTGDVMYTPTQEALLGLHLLSKWGKESGKTFSTVKDLETSVNNGEVSPTDVVKVHGLFGGKDTTYGRILIDSRLPRGFIKNTEVLHSKDFTITKKSINENITGPLVRNHEDAYAKSIDGLKDLGNEWSYKMGFSFGLKDLAPVKDRDKIIKAYKAKADVISATNKDTHTKDKELVDNWTLATEELDSASKKQFEGGSNRLATMIYSGARGSVGQLRQMIAAPMLMQDATNKTLTTPVTRSYAEGLDVGDYWMAQHGARKGTLQRAQGTSDPGAISKDIMNTTMSTLITSNDCHTKQGLLIHLSPTEHDKSWKDAADRYLSAPYELKDGTVLHAGTLITPEVLNRLRNSKISKAMVRSPLKCEAADGICAKCFGLAETGKLHEVGTNIGVLAGQALGEPSVQMAMDAYHSGGIASAQRGSKSIDRFARLKNLINMPLHLKDEATLSTVDGHISAISKDPIGANIMVNGVKHFVPATLIKDSLKLGQPISKGEVLSEGFVNPKTLLGVTQDIGATQNHLVKEMHEELFDKEGVRRRNVEVVVRTLTNLTKIKEPGHSHYLHGDMVPRSIVEDFNRSVPKEEAIVHTPVLVGVRQIPSKSNAGWLSRLNYQNLKATIQGAAATGGRTNLHGSHPIPGIAFGAEFGLPPLGSPKHVY